MSVGDGAGPKPPDLHMGGPAWDEQPAVFSGGVIRAPRWPGLSPGKEGGSGRHRSLPVSQARAQNGPTVIRGWHFPITTDNICLN